MRLRDLLFGLPLAASLAGCVGEPSTSIDEPGRSAEDVTDPSQVDPSQVEVASPDAVSVAVAGTSSYDYRNTSGGSGSYEWDPCKGKVTCGPGQALAGLGVSTLDHFGTRGLCRDRGNDFFPLAIKTPLLFSGAPSDKRTASRSIDGPSTDWDSGNYKLECGYDEYVAGISENATACGGSDFKTHGILCAQGNNLPDANHYSCVARPFADGDNRATTLSDDWDSGRAKGECGADEYAAGVSVSPSTGGPHAVLCCSVRGKPLDGDQRATPSPFRDTSTPANPPGGDWDFGYGKASCLSGQALTGVSVNPNDGQGVDGLCRREGDKIATGGSPVRLVMNNANNRLYSRSSQKDGTYWDTGNWKLECGQDQYVSGISESVGSHGIHAIQCSNAPPSTLDSTSLCQVRTLVSSPIAGEPVSDNRGTIVTGDWSSGNYKTECGLNEYMAGVSVMRDGTLRPHAVLCCSKAPTARTMVGTSGQRFSVDGHPFKFVGANMPALPEYDYFFANHYPGENRTTMELQFQEMARMGVEVVRVPAAFYDTAGSPSPHSTLADRFGLVLDMADRYGMYVIPVLTDYYNSREHLAEDNGYYPAPAPTDDTVNASWFQSGYTGAYKRWSQLLVDRFRNHPRVFAWELGNEIKLPADPAAFTAFAYDMATTIRALDSRSFAGFMGQGHLVAPGSISTWANGFHDAYRGYAACFYGGPCPSGSSPNFDFVITHDYNGEGNSNTTGQGSDIWKQRNDGDLAWTYNKPYVIEEGGYHYGQYDRAAQVDYDLNWWTTGAPPDAAYHTNVAGYMTWTLTSKFLPAGPAEEDGDQGMMGAPCGPKLPPCNADYDAIFARYQWWATQFRTGAK